MPLTQAVFSQVLPKALPAELEYTVPKEAVHGERSTTKFLPSNGYATYVPGSTCSITLPAIDSFMDTHSTWFKFAVSLPADHYTDAKTFKTTAAGAHGFLQSVRVVHSSGTVLDEIQGYNVLLATQLSLTVPEDYTNVLGLMQGIGGADLPAGQTEFMIPIKNIIFSNLKHIPLKYLGQIRLEVVFAQAADVLVRTDAGAAFTSPLRYTVHDACIYTSLIRLNDVQVASYDAVFRERGLRLYGESYSHHYLSWYANKQTVSIADRVASMKDIMVVSRDTSQLGPDVHTVDKLVERTNKVQRYQWSIAGRLFPSRPVEGPISALAETMDACHGNLKGYALDRASWTREQNSSFVIMRELETSRSLVSGDSVCRDKQVDIMLTLEAKGNTVPADTIDVFIQHDKVLEFLSSGQVAIYE